MHRLERRTRPRARRVAARQAALGAGRSVGGCDFDVARWALLERPEDGRGPATVSPAAGARDAADADRDLEAAGAQWLTGTRSWSTSKRSRCSSPTSGGCHRWCSDYEGPQTQEARTRLGLA